MECILEASLMERKPHPITKHKRFVLYGTYPNSAFGGTSFIRGTLYEIVPYGNGG